MAMKKAITKKEIKEKNFVATKNAQEEFFGGYRKRRLEYYARVFNLGKLPADKKICELLGINDKLMSVIKYRDLHYGERISEKNKLAYRAMKNLNPAIIAFLLDDSNFDKKFRIKAEKRTLMREALALND